MFSNGPETRNIFPIVLVNFYIEDKRPVMIPVFLSLGQVIFNLPNKFLEKRNTPQALYKQWDKSLLVYNNNSFLLWQWLDEAEIIIAFFLIL